MLADLLNRDVTIAHRGEAEGFDNRQAATSTTTVKGALQQADASEDTQELGSSHSVLWLPAGTEIDAGDTAEVSGRTYEVEGDPWVVVDEETGQPHHIEATLARAGAAAGGAGGLDTAPEEF